QVASALSHPNLAKVYDFGQIDDSLFLAMEYIAGELLSTRIAAGPIPLADALRWTRELLDAVDCGHRVRIIHRDIEPGNIISDEARRVRLLDLGLAKSLERTAITEDVSIAGTPRYLPPEVLAGKESTEKSDLYQVGLILHECLTRKPAFEAETMTQLFSQICT